MQPISPIQHPQQTMSAYQIPASPRAELPTSPMVQHQQLAPQQAGGVRAVVLQPIAASAMHALPVPNTGGAYPNAGGYPSTGGAYPTLGLGGGASLVPAQVLSVLNLMQINVATDLVFWCRSSFESLKKAEGERRWVITAFYFVLACFVPFPMFPVFLVFFLFFYCCQCGNPLHPFLKNGEGTLTVCSRSRGIVQYNLHNNSSVEIPWASVEGFEHFEPGVREACWIRPQHCCVSDPQRCMITVLLPGQHQVAEGFFRGGRPMRDQRVIFCEPAEYEFIMGNLAYLKAQHAASPAPPAVPQPQQPPRPVGMGPPQPAGVVMGVVPPGNDPPAQAFVANDGRRLSVASASTGFVGGQAREGPHGSVVVCGSPVASEANAGAASNEGQNPSATAPSWKVID